MSAEAESIRSALHNFTDGSDQEFRARTAKALTLVVERLNHISEQLRDTAHAVDLILKADRESEDE